MGTDEGTDESGHDKHVKCVETGERGGREVGTGPQEVSQVRTDHGAGGGDVVGHDRRPEGTLVEGQQVTGETHDHGQDQQHDADDPVHLARVLVGTEEEGPGHVQEDQDDHEAGAPLVEAAHELAEEDLVGHVGDRGVGLRGRRRVVHRQEHAGDGLHHEDEHRRRTQGVEPVGPLGHVTGQKCGVDGGAGGARVEPAGDVLAAFGAVVLGQVAGAGHLLLAGDLGDLVFHGHVRGTVAVGFGVLLLACRQESHSVPDQFGGGKVVGRGGYRYSQMPPVNSPGSRTLTALSWLVTL